MSVRIGKNFLPKNKIPNLKICFVLFNSETTSERSWLVGENFLQDCTMCRLGTTELFTRFAGLDGLSVLSRTDFKPFKRLPENCLGHVAHSSDCASVAFAGTLKLQVFLGRSDRRTIEVPTILNGFLRLFASKSFQAHHLTVLATTQRVAQSKLRLSPLLEWTVAAAWHQVLD